MYQFIEFLAVVTSAVYGVLLARRHHMDFVGVFCLAFVVAFGGGTLRDLFLDRHPLFWIREDHYPLIVFAIALQTSLIPKIPDQAEGILSLPDALGLGLFSVVGANAAIEAGTSYFVAALMGAVTGTFGGVIGDIICNRVPSLFRPAPLFATCSFVGCWVFLLLNTWVVSRPYAAPAAIVVIVAFRLAAIRYKWFLPQVESAVSTVGEDQHPNVDS
ncbi:MAG: trimeric intracellular cation channel family protein [Planctomycetaceae bacterium]|nr:trimeric intracellular cation channel family protein [Planctomycetaceae bacterium]MCB9950830.1 trimeric intracellular cation channel family protein [Planctomycetaceae bacterium]